MGNTKAWMLRRDGKYFEVVAHLYGSLEDYEETLYAAEWLYRHTSSEKTKDTIIEFIASWAMDNVRGGDSSAIIDYIKDVGYIIMTPDFVKSISNKIDNSNIGDTDYLNAKVCTLLNNEFCRVRDGGVVNSYNNGEYYFRISSNGFNWFNVIWEFVYTKRNSIKSVTIVRDEESTGENFIYKISGEPVDKMSVDSFITLKGNPIIEKLILERG